MLTKKILSAAAALAEENIETSIERRDGRKAKYKIYGEKSKSKCQALAVVKSSAWNDFEAIISHAFDDLRLEKEFIVC